MKNTWKRRWYLFNASWHKVWRIWYITSCLIFGYVVSIEFAKMLQDTKPTFYPVEVVHAADFPVAADRMEPMEVLIRRLASEAKFQWPDYLVRLARCESRMNPFATQYMLNSPKGSLDRGLFGINDFWHKEVTNVQAFDPVWSTKWAMQQINAGKQHEWMCDPLVRSNPHKYD